MDGDLKINETVEQAIKDIKTIKESMVQSGNDIARIVYGIRDELTERNACRDFALAVGMSKASISKMVTSETLRSVYGISSAVSYNTIYKVKDLLYSDNEQNCWDVAWLLNEGKSVSEIEHLLNTPEDTPDNTAEDTSEDASEDTADDTADNTVDDTAETRSEIVSQIFGILDSYDIQKDDIKLLKMLIKGLR